MDGMRRALVFGVLYTAFAAGALVTCFLGRAGVKSYDALASYASSLKQNIVDLKERNAALAGDFDLLRSDRGTVQLLARGFGLLEPGERRVVMETYRPERRAGEVGHVIASPEPDTRPRLETLYLVPLILLFVGVAFDGARLGRSSAAPEREGAYQESGS
jgi:cell division protein FtsB